MRIKVVQNLKKYIKDDEVIYACHAFMICNEEHFNEQWFDVFLYYALIGLSNPKVNIRVYSLNVLNTIAVQNAESILDITEKVLAVSAEKHWEIKAQCLEFAITILNSYKNHSHLVDDSKGSKGGGKPTSPAQNAGSGGGQGDRATIKQNLQCAMDIISNCFSNDSSKAVRKIGLFKLQSLLNDFKKLYPLYMDTLVNSEEDVKQIILSDEPTTNPIFF